MKISTRGRYALRFMLYLATQETDSYITLKDVSNHENISIKYLEQIAALLSKEKFLDSVRGPQGGYKLSKAPSEYTVADILRVTEGNLAPVACLESIENPCERKAECLTLPFWLGLQNTINNYLESVTLQNIIEKQF